MLVGEQHKTRLKLGGTGHCAAINSTSSQTIRTILLGTVRKITTVREHRPLSTDYSNYFLADIEDGWQDHHHGRVQKKFELSFLFCGACLAFSVVIPQGFVELIVVLPSSREERGGVVGGMMMDDNGRTESDCGGVDTEKCFPRSVSFRRAYY